jgi:hypothetical protein
MNLNGNLSIGTKNAPEGSSVLDLVSTDKGFLPPRMTTTQRNSISNPVEGLVIHNLTTNKLNHYNGTIWEQLDQASAYTETEINIGMWNMDTTDSVSVAHGIANYKNIREVSVVIRDDLDTDYLGLGKVNNGDDGLVEWDGTNIILKRTTGGYFDASGYSKTVGSYNRGFIYIKYKA